MNARGSTVATRRLTPRITQNRGWRAQDLLELIVQFMREHARKALFASANNDRLQRRAKRCEKREFFTVCIDKQGHTYTRLWGLWFLVGWWAWTVCVPPPVSVGIEIDRGPAD